MYISIMRGATAYEFQIGSVVFRFVHLRGGKWTLRNFAQRFTINRYKDHR